jgi:hypothetical protein
MDGWMDGWTDGRMDGWMSVILDWTIAPFSDADKIEMKFWRWRLW